MNTPTNRRTAEERPGKNSAPQSADKWVAAQLAKAPRLSTDRAERIAAMLRAADRGG